MYVKGSAECKAGCSGILAFITTNIGLLNLAYLGVFSWKEDSSQQSTGPFGATELIAFSGP